jgi:diguanylate cyclase
VLTIDDFGTGYSALSRLERLPVRAVKIDRSFVAGIGTPRRGGTIARAVVAMGRSLGLTVIAEGVETEAQRAYLAAAGCHAAQGYLLGRPQPADEFRRLLLQRPAAPVAPGTATPTRRARGTSSNRC